MAFIFHDAAALNIKFSCIWIILVALELDWLHLNKIDCCRTANPLPGPSGHLDWFMDRSDLEIKRQIFDKTHFFCQINLIREQFSCGLAKIQSIFIITCLMLEWGGKTFLEFRRFGIGLGIGKSGLGPCKILQNGRPPFLPHPGYNGWRGGWCPWCRRCPSRCRSSPLWCQIGKLCSLQACPALRHWPWVAATPGGIAGCVGTPVSRFGKFCQILALSTKIQIRRKWGAFDWQGYLWKVWQNVRSFGAQDFAGLSRI